MKKFLIGFFLFLIINSPSYAQNLFKANATLQDELNLKQTAGAKIDFINNEEINVPNIVLIPEKSLITGEILRIQKELRWHKSGYAILKLISYKEENKNPVDISEKNIYVAARQYRYPDKKEAVITGTEIAGSAAASFFLPGVDIAYFFTKGAIVRDKDPNWFKSGVSKAYENSILWFIMKGKDIDLEEGDMIQLKYFENKKLEKTVAKIDKRKQKEIKKEEKREIKKDQKDKKKQIKEEKKLQKEKEKAEKMSKEKLEKYLAKKEQKKLKKETKEIRKQLEYENWKEKWDEINEQREQELKKQAEKRKQKRLQKETEKAFQ